MDRKTQRSVFQGKKKEGEKHTSVDTTKAERKGGGNRSVGFRIPLRTSEQKRLHGGEAQFFHPG